MRYWWAHYETGSPLPHFAWCNICDTAMAFWAGPVGTPPTRGARAKMTEHHATHGFAMLTPCEVGQ